MNDTDVIWRPNPGPQTEFLSCPAREVLYAGSVGSGKTDGLLMCGASQTGNGKHRALILRRTFPMLRDLIGRSHELFLPLGAQYNKQSSQWTFPSGAVLEFGFLDADEDKYRYMGRAFSFLGWDELTSWPGDATDAQGQPCNGSYVYLSLTRLRATEGSGLRLEVRATCTPGGVGNSWVQSRWNIPNDGGASEVIDAQNGYRRVFIPARISDNPYLHNTEYERSLATLPEATRKALLLGRWDVFEGAVFSEFDPTKHVCEPFAVPAGWEIWRACDDGFACPASVHWLTQNPDDKTIYVIAEIYKRGMLPEQLAREILDVDRSIMLDFGLGDLEPNDEPLSGVIDSAAFSDVGTGKASRGQTMNERGCNWRPVQKGTGSVAAGLSAIHSALALRKDGTPRLRIFRGCKNLIRTLPTLVYDTANPETFDSNCECHAVDSLRYALTRRKVWFSRVRVRGL
jgi:hypothetical protein